MQESVNEYSHEVDCERGRRGSVDRQLLRSLAQIGSVLTPSNIIQVNLINNWFDSPSFESQETNYLKPVKSIFVKLNRLKTMHELSGEITLVANSATPALTDSQTLDTVVNCLSEHLPISTQGNCHQQNIFEILIRAATQRDSIENTTRVLRNAPSSNTIRYHLDKYDALDDLEIALNQALQSRLPERLEQSEPKIAIDFNLIPYYGNPSPTELPFIYRSKAKNGTCSFYAYATLYVITPFPPEDFVFGGGELMRSHKFSAQQGD